MLSNRVRLFPKKSANTTKKQCTRHIKTILPMVVKLQNFERYTVDEIMNLFLNITNSECYKLLDETEKQTLKKYLDKRGYKTDWIR